jgi:hypothetical protein
MGCGWNVCAERRAASKCGVVVPRSFVSPSVPRDLSYEK